MQFIGKVWHFIRLTRPLFLMGGFLLYILGALIAWKEGAVIHPTRLFIGQMLVTSIQLMTHYANEYYDQEGDRLNQGRTWFSGGSGVLGGGDLSAVIALRAAHVMAGFGLLFLILAGLQVPLLFLLGTVGLFAAWFYSAPPISLSGSGWGEVSASLVVALLVPLVGYTLQSAGQIGSFLLPVCLSLMLVHVAMLIAFAIPDYFADIQVGKRTLAVRLGPGSAVTIHNLALIAAFAILLTLALSGWPAARFTWLAVPLAIWQTATIRAYLDQKTHRYFGLTMKALGLFALSAILWMAGFVLS